MYDKKINDLYDFLNDETEIFDKMKIINHAIKAGSIILNPYHEEGSVYAHTMLVVEEIKKIDYNNLYCHDNIIVAAFLHDYGKCFVRNVNEKNYVTFYNHENIVIFKIIDILKRIKNEVEGFEGIDIVTILYLINYHMFDLNLDKVKKVSDMFFDEHKTFISKNNKSFLTEFIDLKRADNIGRICRDKTSISFFDKFYFELMHSYNFLEKDYVSAFSPTCTILIGPPCSGKSTYIKNSHLRNIISRDEIMLKNSKSDSYIDSFKNSNHKEIDKMLNESIRDNVKAKENFVVDMTNCSIKSRRRKLGALTKNYRKKAIVFIEDETVLFDRNRNREGKVLSNDIIVRMMNSFKLPTYAEFHEIEIRV